MSGSSFLRSTVPAEAFVATAKVNPTVVGTAMKAFKKKCLPLPGALRKFFWEECIMDPENEPQQKDRKGKGKKVSWKIKIKFDFEFFSYCRISRILTAIPTRS